ncbi:hypothetical protein NHX12_007191 [Muraenolepis orangiensis]|uniref:Uncharacterized protein n=1 Tax=Muraenolepis orangiensis TaxID=630683 RepID=A0A9Q0ICR8_9TELE|nr:hypothetical protein NHX12_007191 [Muraenolepis orangiensis]
MCEVRVQSTLTHLTPSLSRERQKQETLRVAKENQGMLVRLSLCRPFYSVTAWHQEWLKTLKVMESIRQYPPRHKREGVIFGCLVCNSYQELGQQGLEENTKVDPTGRHPEKHPLNSKANAEEKVGGEEAEMQNTAEEQSCLTSSGPSESMEKPTSSASEDCSGTDSSNQYE